jgi:hypothetical protein
MKRRVAAESLERLQSELELTQHERGIREISGTTAGHDFAELRQLDVVKCP